VPPFSDRASRGSAPDAGTRLPRCPATRPLPGGPAAKGRELGAQARAQRGDGTEAVSAVLADCGYEPRADAAGITLANCPFHDLATEYTDLVCGMNINLLDGVLESGPATDPCARLDPVEGRCCVVLERQQQ